VLTIAFNQSLVPYNKVLYALCRGTTVYECIISIVKVKKLTLGELCQFLFSETHT